jgi:hypothetical protein
LRAGELLVDPPIAFEQKTARLPAESRQALTEIADTLRANPDLARVVIGLGTRGASQELMSQRADRLILLFEQQNLASERYNIELRDDLESGEVAVGLRQR